MSEIYTKISDFVGKNFYILFLIQPLLYLDSAYNSRNGGSILSLYFEFNVFLIIVSIIYLFFYSKAKNIKFLKRSVSLFLLFALITLSNLYYIKPSYNMINEVVYLLPYLYFPVVTAAFVSLFEEKRITRNIFKLIIPFFIYAGVMLAADLTNTSFTTYVDDIHEGQQGWFIFANRLSSIISILTPFVFYYIYTNKEKTISYILLFLHLYATLSIGTKAPVVATILTLVGLITYTLLKERSIKSIVYPYIMYALLFIVFIPISPIVHNLKVQVDLTDSNLDYVMSSRHEYLIDNVELFIYTDFKEQLIGRGFTDEGNTLYKWVEIDPYDVFFARGIVGFSIYVYFLLELVVLMLKSNSKKLKELFWDKEFIVYLGTVILCVLIMNVSGYIIPYFKTSIYFAIFLAFLKDKLEDKSM